MAVSYVTYGHASERPFSIGEYFRTRFTTLRPPMAKAPNPFKLMGTLNKQQWLFFAVAFLAWMWDAFDFFTVSLTVSDLAATFHKSITDITWGITLVLMFRTVGSIIVGIVSDRYGRKWPFIGNLVLFIVLELGTGFCQNYQQFLAIRALYGIAMGGLYGNAVATALEDCPMEARGIMSGILQQGYTFGYLLTTAFARGLVNTTPHGWRPLYWFGACPPVLFIIFRLCLPETQAFQERQRVRLEQPSVAGTFITETKVALKRHWMMIVYLVLLLALFNFMAHGSQDLYPTLLTNQFEFSPNMVTVTQVVANLGAMLGGTTVGYCSQIFGRRLSIVVVCVAGAALLYPYTYVSSSAVIAAAFFEQFCVQGAFGVVPIHMMELSPGPLRTFVVGTAYQLGNLASSASSTIEAKLGERYPLPPMDKGGALVKRYNYGKVICIFLGAIYACLIILTLLGPENRGRNLDVEYDEDVVEATHGHLHVDRKGGGDHESERGDDKAYAHAEERV